MLTVKAMLIYLITNKVNNKVYVGQTTRTQKKEKNSHINIIKFLI